MSSGPSPEQAHRRIAISLSMCWCRPHPCRFNTQEHRFEQRFAFLQRLARPEPLGYAPLLRDMDACAPPVLLST